MLQLVLSYLVFQTVDCVFHPQRVLVEKAVLTFSGSQSKLYSFKSELEEV